MENNEWLPYYVSSQHGSVFGIGPHGNNWISIIRNEEGWQIVLINVASYRSNKEVTILDTFKIYQRSKAIKHFAALIQNWE